jgi:hypothetical protein
MSHELHLVKKIIIDLTALLSCLTLDREYPLCY